MKKRSHLRWWKRAICKLAPPRHSAFFYSLLMIGLFGLALLAACRRNADQQTALPFPAPESVQASFGGKVVDEAGQPVAGARVSAGGVVVNTDATGSFAIVNAQVDKHAAYIQVEKNGYFTGSRTMMVTAGSSREASIQLMEKKKAGEITSAGGAVTVPDNGGTVAFPASAVVNPTSGQTYAGTVSVAARYLNPVADNITDIMPGELRAIANDGTECGLQSFSMMAVELSGANGEKLQLAPGKVATLTFPIPQALQSQAPPTIPLWYFDETKGLWKEEGVAKKEGGNYVGTVKHFSFWNCDLPFAPVDLEAAFKDQAGQPLPGLRIIVQNDDPADRSILGNATTDQAGKIHSKIPANRSLKMIVRHPLGMELHSQAIISNSNAVSLGSITINTSALPRVKLTGSVKDCGANGVSNGFVAIQLDGQTYKAILREGQFALEVDRANANTAQATFAGYNLVDNKASEPLTIPVTTGDAPTVSLTACSDPSEYINLVIDNKQIHYNVVKDQIKATSNNTHIFLEVLLKGKEEQGNVFMLKTLGWQTGENDLHFMAFMKSLEGDSESFSTNTESELYPSKVVITKHDIKDGYRWLEGSFTGAPVIGFDSHEPKVVYGNFRVKVK